MWEGIAMATALAMTGTGGPAAGLAQIGGTGSGKTAASVSLSRDQKAAIIVRLLLANQGSFKLDGLEDTHQARLVRAMAGLSYVNEATTLAVIQEFLTEFGSLGLYFRPGLESALSSLKSHLADNVPALLNASSTSDAPLDPWDTIKTQEASALASVLAIETPHIIAIVLTKLPPGKAAEVLAELDMAVAHAATLVATKDITVTLETVAGIGQAIAQALTQAGDKGALAGDPTERVGAILNFAPGGAREDLLNGLESADRHLAEQVRKVMFTFTDIPDRIEIKDIPKLVRGVENDMLVTALAGAGTSGKDVVDFILTNLSKRLSEQLIEEIREVGEVKPKEADTAMNAIIQVARDLEQSGEIILIAPED